MDSLIIRNKAGDVLLNAKKHVRFDLNDANLTGAQLEGVNLEGASCMNTQFRDANLKNADLYWVIAFEADFSGADLSGARLHGADLKRANFTNANLTATSFRKDNVGGSTDLRGAELEQAHITPETQFEGAVYSNSTRFPKGFDPVSRSMIQKEDPQGGVP